MKMIEKNCPDCIELNVLIDRYSKWMITSEEEVVVLMRLDLFVADDLQL